MTNYPSLVAKKKLYTSIIKEQHCKPKSERRKDLPVIKVKLETINRWLKELGSK